MPLYMKGQRGISHDLMPGQKGLENDPNLFKIGLRFSCIQCLYNLQYHLVSFLWKRKVSDASFVLFNTSSKKVIPSKLFLSPLCLNHQIEISVFFPQLFRLVGNRSNLPNYDPEPEKVNSGFAPVNTGLNLNPSDTIGPNHPLTRGQRSTEVAFLLPTQQPRVRITAQP